MTPPGGGFRLPTFNLIVNVWRGSLGPPPILALPTHTFTAVLKSPNRTAVGVTDWIGVMYLLLPSRVDIRGAASSTGSDYVECPAGSGRYYQVGYVDDTGRNFPNEHRFATLAQVSPFPQT